MNVSFLFVRTHSCPHCAHATSLRRLFLVRLRSALRLVASGTGPAAKHLPLCVVRVCARACVCVLCDELLQLWKPAAVASGFFFFYLPVQQEQTKTHTRTLKDSGTD